MDKGGKFMIETIIISLGTALAGTFSGWFFGRKKQSIETIDMALNTWQKVIDNLEKRIECMLVESKQLREENESLRQEIRELRVELDSFKNQQRKIDKYEKNIKQLEEKLAAYENLLTVNGIKF